MTPCNYRIESRLQKAKVIRCRHETVNRKLKVFEALKQVFRHDLSKHQTVFDAVVVLTQLSISFGGEKLFDTEY